MVDIHIKTIPHENQAYETVGNYRDLEGGLLVEVSEMNNPDYEFLVIIHELVEWYLTRKRGISDEQIVSFDKRFEEMRAAYPDIIKNAEPGNHPGAPYKLEHRFAESIERRVANELGVEWKAYDEAANAL